MGKLLIIFPGLMRAPGPGHPTVSLRCLFMSVHISFLCFVLFCSSCFLTLVSGQPLQLSTNISRAPAVFRTDFRGPFRDCSTNRP